MANAENEIRNGSIANTMSIEKADKEKTQEQHGEVGLVDWQDFEDNRPFEMERGGILPKINLRFETYGELSPSKENAILICHALTGDHHCAGRYSDKETKAGWWDKVVGPGKSIDTNKFFVICSNSLGACQGSTGPTSLNPDTGKPYGLDFPELTIGDMVNAQRRLIEHLHLESLYAVVGGSMGGMQALQWIVSFPDFVKHGLIIAATASHNAQTIAFNEVGRAAIRDDPNWNQGNYRDDNRPEAGLAIARMMAHITYLSGEGMDRKFGRSKRKSTGERFGVEFEVESYLRHQGKTFVNRFDANTYLNLTKALDRFDLHDTNGSLDKTFENIKSRTLVVGFTSDWLYTPKQNREIVESLQRLGKDASYAEIDHDFGHDSFLLDSRKFHRLIKVFLEGADEEELQLQSSIPEKITRTDAKKESDFKVIDEWIAPTSQILDLGCGRGILLEHLATGKQVKGLGVDLDIEKVIGCVSRKVPVYQGDIHSTLERFEENSFDWIVFSRTMEELERPGEAIDKSLNIAERVVVSFVNYGYWLNRLHYLLKGCRIKNDVYDRSWHEREPGNPIAIRDFEKFCEGEGLIAKRRIYLGGDWQRKISFMPNLFAGVAIYEIARKN